MRSNTDYDKKAYILLPSCDLGPAIGGGRQSFQGRPTPTDTGFENYLFIFVFNFINIGIIIRRRRSAKRRAKRSSQVADLPVWIFHGLIPIYSRWFPEFWGHQLQCQKLWYHQKQRLLFKKKSNLNKGQRRAALKVRTKVCKIMDKMLQEKSTWKRLGRRRRTLNWETSSPRWLLYIYPSTYWISHTHIGMKT